MTVSVLAVLLGVALWQSYSLIWGDSRGGPYSAKRSGPLGGTPVPAAVLNNSSR